jgi:Ni,Fe-hydrogenase I cytochrome b subunit
MKKNIEEKNCKLSKMVLRRIPHRTNFLRSLHWINAILLLILISLALGFEFGEELGMSESLEENLEVLHASVGHVLAITILVRVVSVFTGKEYKKWTSVIPCRRSDWKGVGGKLCAMIGLGGRGRPAPVGTNPIATLLYIAVFFVIIGQAVTGIFMAGEEFKMIPGVMLVSGGESEMVEQMEEFHEFGFWFIIFFVGLHIAGPVVQLATRALSSAGSAAQSKKGFNSSSSGGL